MRARIVSILLLALALALADGAAVRAQETYALWRENLTLAAEYELAQRPKMYYILDLGERSVLLKTRGMVLKQIPVAELGIWGPPLQVGLHAVEEKDALAQPARPAIKPGEEKTLENLDESILELRNMPTAYRLRLEDDIEVEVLPTPEGFWPRARQRLYLWRWRLGRPLLTLRERRERRESTSLYLVLKPEDAQALYWTLYEGLEGVIAPPAR